jgi:hypothetical protein
MNQTTVQPSNPSENSQLEKNEVQPSSSTGEDDTHEYPPMRMVVIIMCALYIAMFLVSLVCYPFLAPILTIFSF